MMTNVKDRDSDKNKYTGNIERNAVGSILRNSWNDTLRENQHISDLLDAHVRHIRLLLGDIDYEVYVVDAVIANIKNAGREEVAKYLRTLEALAFGYVKLFGKEVASVMLHGIVARSRTTKSLRKYYRSVNYSINNRIEKLNNRYDKENEALHKTRRELRFCEFGFLRFLRSASIRRLNARIHNKSRKMAKLEDRIIDYALAQSRLHNTVYGIEPVEEMA